MNEKDLEILCILAKATTLTEAASRMQMTQSALSKRIQALEQELDETLLLRSRHGIRLTAQGETAAQGAAAAAAALSGMRAKLQAQRGEICGTLRLGVSVNYAAYRLPDLLSVFHKQYPNVRLKLSTGHSRLLYEHLTGGTLDAAILRGDFVWDGYRYLIAQEYMCVICAKEYAYTPLTDYPYIGRETDAGMSQLIARWLREQDLSHLQPELRVDSLAACMALAERGLGWSIVPEIGLENFRGIIRRCTFEDGHPFERKTWLLTSRESASLGQTHAFINTVKDIR